MISQWNVTAFKSIYKTDPLEFSPLTIFAGANNSGKSSLIQSILLTAQTIQSTVFTRSVILNGHVIRLGTFDDIQSNGVDTKTVSIGFRLELSKNDTESVPSTTRRYYRTRRDIAEVPHSVDCEFSFSATGGDAQAEILQLQPRLEEVRLLVHNGEGSSTSEDEIHIRRNHRSAYETAIANNLGGLAQRRGDLSSLEYEVVTPTQVDTRRRVYWRQRVLGQAAAKPIGATLRHFLPQGVSIAYDAVNMQASYLASILLDVPDFRFARLDSSDEALIRENKEVQNWITSGIASLVRDQAELIPNRLEHALRALESDFSVTNLAAAYSSLRPSEKKDLEVLWNNKLPELMALIKHDKKPDYQLAVIPNSEAVEAAVEQIYQFFAQKVKYLGPLRDEPKPVYPRARMSRP